VKAVVVALVAFGTLLVVLGANLAGADLTDKVTSDGNTFATDDLAVPTLTATGSGTGATGSVLLSWTPPSFAATWDIFRAAATCASAPSFGAALASNLTASPYTDSPVAAGTYCYKVRAKYQSWSEDSAPKEVTIAKASPTLSTTPITTGLTTVVGVAVLNDSGTLSGASSPTGSITFNLFPPSDGTCSLAAVFTVTVALTGSGASTTTGPTSNAAGDWHWTASYPGDSNNNPASSACASEKVTVDKASPTLSTTPSAGGTVGVAVLNDSATLSGGYNPTGSITFKLYAPSASTCTGTPSFTQTVTVTSGTSTYTTTNSTATNAAGTWRWTASYAGDSNNNTVASGCDDEKVTIDKASPTLSTTPVTTGGTVVGKAVLNDSGSVSGGYNVTGSITFNLFRPSDATCSGTPVFSVTVSLTGTGASTTTGPTSDAAGDWHWTASYSGDTNNLTVSSSCSSEAVTIAKVTPTLYTIPNTSTGTVGDVLKDSGLLGAGYNPTGNIVFKLFSPSDPDCTGTASFTETVTVNAGNGTYSTVGGGTTNAAGVWHWTADYSGDANNNVAASACGEAVTIAPAGTTTQLSGDNTLLDSGASGGPIEVEATVANSVFESWSKTAVTATSHSGWSVTLNIVQNSHGNFSPSGTNADVVVYLISSGACSTTVPSAANTLASALIVPVVLGSNIIPLTASGTLTTPATGKLCLRVTNHSSNSGNAHDFAISTAGLSTISGPF